MKQNFSAGELRQNIKQLPSWTKINMKLLLDEVLILEGLDRNSFNQALTLATGIWADMCRNIKCRFFLFGEVEDSWSSWVDCEWTLNCFCFETEIIMLAY